MARGAAGKAASQRSVGDEISKDNQPTSDVVEHLQRQLANAFVLYANYKHYHWQTFGPLFRDLHLLFDEFATEVLATIDDFAERVRMIGQDPVFRPDEVERIASVNVADDHDDPGTVDLFSRHVQIHEKHEWWLRDILEKGDGLST
jgi:starvation-inducible DNA-binding protein